MIFKVPENFEGSCVLHTLKKALSAGMTVSICGNDLYAPDIRRAIEQGLLKSTDPNYKKKKASSRVVIVNKTDQVLVLGDLVLRPRATLPVDRDKAESIPMQAAKKNNFINIIYDKTPSSKKKSSMKKKRKSPKSKKVEVVEIKDKKVKSGEDIDVEPVVWDFKTKKTKKAQKVPKAPKLVKIDEEKEEKDVDFVDKKTKKKKSKKKKKKTTRKKSQKKTSKKKDKHLKKKKVKTIHPVGEARPPLTAADAVIELDSRGNVKKKASDELQHMIDSLHVPGEVGFVDKEQEQERLREK
ncbi:MAG: hypothetical protein ACTSSP_10660 [Candidatus Asgardarchaeia archaeon]